MMSFFLEFDANWCSWKVFFGAIYTFSCSRALIIKFDRKWWFVDIETSVWVNLITCCYWKGLQKFFANRISFSKSKLICKILFKWIANILNFEYPDWISWMLVKLIGDFEVYWFDNWFEPICLVTTGFVGWTVSSIGTLILSCMFSYLFL